jgi:beta-glucosidase/6-phospho-beta-glucosidase/beta-galactosidase
VDVPGRIPLFDDFFCFPIINTLQIAFDELGESTMPIKEALNDTFRVQYYSEYLDEVKRAIVDGVNVRG